MSSKNFPAAGHGEFTVENPPVSEWIAHNQLADHKFADVAFAFDRKQVFAHSAILCVRSNVLHEMYDKLNSKKKSKKHQRSLVTLTIPQPYGADYPITSETFELVLQFLYADNIQFESIGAREALDLCNAAKALELPRLSRLSRDRVHEAISLDNVHALLKVAHDTKEELTRSYCIRFASTVKKDFIGNKDEIAKIGVDLFQDVMANLMILEDDEGLKETTPVPESTLNADFRKLCTDTEVGAIQGDSLISFKGSEVMFHKSFFAARSKSLSQSFQPSLDGNENTTEILKVKDLLTTVDAFKAILKYLYYGDLSGLTVLIACEVTEFAKTHGMPELQYICEFVMAVNINVDSVMSIMRVVFNPGNIKRPDLEEIRKNTLTFFRQNIGDLDLTMGNLLQNGPLVMAEIIMSWQVARKDGVDDKAHKAHHKRRASKKPESEEGTSGLAQSESGQSLADELSAKDDKAEKKKRRREKGSRKNDAKRSSKVSTKKEGKEGKGKEEKAE